MRIIKFCIIPIFFLIILNSVTADELMLSEKPVEYCASLNNIDNFPDYVFLFFSKTPIGRNYQVMKQDECIKFYYKIGSTKLFAIKKNKFDEKALIDTSWVSEADIPKESKELYLRLENSSDEYSKKRLEEFKEVIILDNFFDINPDLFFIVDIPDIRNVHISDPRSKIINSYKIIQEGNSFRIENKTSNIYINLTNLIYLIMIIIGLFMITKLGKKK